MSVAIATMGKFIPIFGENIVQEVVGVGGGSSYGWNKPKPIVIVDSVYDSDDDLRIKVIKVTEWS